MFRNKKIDEYGNIVFAAVNDLFKVCEQNALSKTDLLLCFQNGFRSWDATPCIGIGEEGLDSLQGFNSAFACGLPHTTDDMDYFKKLNPLDFNGVSEFERILHEEMIRYLNVWENPYILRLLIQLSHLANGEHYDWDLSINELIKKRGGVKSNVIETDILKHFSLAPTFELVLKSAYNRNLRNGIAHSQCVVVQHGIILKTPKNYNCHKLEGVTFEEWEKLFLYSYLLVVGVRKILKDMSDMYTQYLVRKKCGIPILIPNNDGTSWYYNKTYPYNYPNKPEAIWRFTKPDWAVD